MSTRLRLTVVALAATALLALAVLPVGEKQRLPLHLTLSPASILADGHDTATLELVAPPGAPPHIEAQGVRVEDVVHTPGGWRARLRSGVLPGRARIRAEAGGFLPAEATLELRLEPGDRAGDGTPDFLRLDDDADRQAFRRWFTFLAEAQYLQHPPAEITDCAALIRYAYREALRPHDAAWAAGAGLAIVPALPSIGKYEYPRTPLGAALFRIRPGPFQPSDLSDGAFAQFADARTLQSLNARLVSRDLERARPGDLLFFRRLAEPMPFHSMVFVGESHFGAGRVVVYHTGPDGNSAGEIRRVMVDELMRHPDARWHPTPANSSFLGVYRWNILREALP